MCIIRTPYARPCALERRSERMLPAERMVGEASGAPRPAHECRASEALVRGWLRRGIPGRGRALAATLPSDARARSAVGRGARGRLRAGLAASASSSATPTWSRSSSCSSRMLLVAPLPMVPMMVAAGARSGDGPGLHSRHAGTGNEPSPRSATAGSPSARFSCSRRSRPDRRAWLAAAVYALAYLRAGRRRPGLDPAPRPPDRSRAAGGAAALLRGLRPGGRDPVPIAFLVAVSATEAPVVLLAFAPLVWLLRDLLARPARAIRRGPRAATAPTAAR